MVDYSRDIFLDGNSTTPADPRVVRSICAAYNQRLGNPSSNHRSGWRAKRLLEQARKNLAAFTKCETEEIIFVPSVTVGLNIAIQGLLGKARYGRIATSRVEHKSILALVRHACSVRQVEWIELSCDQYGAVLPDSVGHAANRGVDLICVSHGNGETGAVNDIRGMSVELQQAAPFVVDVSQTAAYMDLPLPGEVSCLVFSGHKIYGPRGAAALYKNRELEVSPLLIGAGQESGLVPGTEDVPGAVALGVAARLAERERAKRREYVNLLRDVFWRILSHRVPYSETNGNPALRMPGNLSVTIPHVPAELLIKRLLHISFSMASACTGTSESHVLRALGFSRARIACTFRVGFNAFNHLDEVEQAAAEIAKIATTLRRRH